MPDTTHDLPLTFLERRAAPGVDQPWLLVLMHGVGSNERDLFGFAPYVPPQFHVLSLRAPFTVGPDSHAWFDFTVHPDASRTIDAAQERAARDLVERTVQQAAQQRGIPPARVVVGGFSQGGIMALTLLLTAPQHIGAALAWHSRLLPEAASARAPREAFAGKALWVSHGTEDGVIPLAQAHAIRDAAAALPLALTYREFPGAHEIRPAELSQTVQWLNALSAQPQQQPPPA
ncbi:alpha/beta hydrolase [Xylophilus sp.]|uniref:alpha/beta hydrolase n=1 Tax=Xylophilus sp. TaxID=2653893 RepID=UPI0013BA74ED|nr:dienelactone hydrolase family protein [Xylophilus sp.]KAF1047096.1 MAG: Carboxylesterase 2 [Xylophilus sp.]